MLNTLTIVGRVSDLKENTLIIKVPRSYKNSDGIYENDFITCKLYKQLNTTASEYLVIGDLVGIKGHLQCNNENDKMVVVVEKITFLSSRKAEDDGE